MMMVVGVVAFERRVTVSRTLEASKNWEEPSPGADWPGRTRGGAVSSTAPLGSEVTRGSVTLSEFRQGLRKLKVTALGDEARRQCHAAARRVQRPQRGHSGDDDVCAEGNVLEEYATQAITTRACHEGKANRVERVAREDVHQGCGAREQPFRAFWLLRFGRWARKLALRAIEHELRQRSRIRGAAPRSAAAAQSRCAS